MTLLLRSFVHASSADALAPLGLVAVRAGGVVALATAHDAMPEANEEGLRAHETLTRRIHDACPSLPARFGSAFADEAALKDALAPRAADMARALEAVSGRVEMGLTLQWRDARDRVAAPESGSGRAYLESRAARERVRREAERLAARLIGELGYEQAFIRQCICPRTGVAATVALLIPRDEVMRLRRHVASLRERTSEVSLAVYGPLAPYSFAP